MHACSQPYALCYLGAANSSVWWPSHDHRTAPTPDNWDEASKRNFFLTIGVRVRKRKQLRFTIPLLHQQLHNIFGLVWGPM